jgi:hypothetical protein
MVKASDFPDEDLHAEEAILGSGTSGLDGQGRNLETYSN